MADKIGELLGRNGGRLINLIKENAVNIEKAAKAGGKIFGFLAVLPMLFDAYAQIKKAGEDFGSGSVEQLGVSGMWAARIGSGLIPMPGGMLGGEALATGIEALIEQLTGKDLPDSPFMAIAKGTQDLGQYAVDKVQGNQGAVDEMLKDWKEEGQPPTIYPGFHK